MSRVRPKTFPETLAWGAVGGLLISFTLIFLMSIRTNGGKLSMEFDWVFRNFGIVVLWTIAAMAISVVMASFLEFLERILGRHG